MSTLINSADTDVTHLLVPDPERHGWTVHCSFVDAHWGAHESSAGLSVRCLSCMEEVPFPDAVVTS